MREALWKRRRRRRSRRNIPCSHNNTMYGFIFKIFIFYKNI